MLFRSIDGNALVKEADVNAIRKRTNYGEELRHQSWIAYEFKTLETLYEAGADVPKPYAMEKNAILMSYIGDYGNAAPTLNSVRLERDEARQLLDRVILNLNLLLDNERIHGDLSAYNILYWEGAITLIDFPQVVHPEANPSAWVIFLRDVTRVCQYFKAQGVKCDGRKLAAQLTQECQFVFVISLECRGASHRLPTLASPVQKKPPLSQTTNPRRFFRRKHLHEL